MGGLPKEAYFTNNYIMIKYLYWTDFVLNNVYKDCVYEFEVIYNYPIQNANYTLVAHYIVHISKCCHIILYYVNFDALPAF